MRRRGVKSLTVFAPNKSLAILAASGMYSLKWLMTAVHLLWGGASK
jgi:hypothetical protein